MKEVVLLAQRGRDVPVAERLQGNRLHIIGEYENPPLVDMAVESGGHFHPIDSITNVQDIADLVQAIEPNMFITHFDDALAAGQVNALKQRVKDKRMKDLLIPCPDREAARVEWDKFFLRKIIEEIGCEIGHDYNPDHFMCTTEAEVREAVAYFETSNTEIAVKPRGLTGGKGVKVQDKHFDTYEEGYQYALRFLGAHENSGAEIQEKLEGHEFTLQILTDGKTMIRPPATYDFPYREDGDTGPGSGGTGAFSMKDGLLPFVTREDYDEAMDLMDKVLDKLRERGIDYKGVLYPTFFNTSKGLKIVEINARGGDPELINVTDLMEDDVDYYQVMEQIALGELATNSVKYKKAASALIYLMAPQYAYRDTGPNYDFELDFHIINLLECKVRLGAVRRIPEIKNRLQSMGPRRIFALSAQGDQPWQARAKIIEAIHYGYKNGRPPFHYRRDIASKEYIDSLAS